MQHVTMLAKNVSQDATRRVMFPIREAGESTKSVASTVINTLIEVSQIILGLLLAAARKHIVGPTLSTSAVLRGKTFDWSSVFA